MMYLQLIPELTLIGNMDAGKPDQERIILKPNETVNLAKFGLGLGVVQPQGGMLPLWDHFYWFGDFEVSPPGWIILYTGKGETKFSQDPESKDPLYIFHWGRQYTLLGERIVSYIVRFDGFSMGFNLDPQKQLP